MFGRGGASHAEPEDGVVLLDVGFLDLVPGPLHVEFQFDGCVVGEGRFALLLAVEAQAAED